MEQKSSELCPHIHSINLNKVKSQIGRKKAQEMLVCQKCVPECLKRTKKRKKGKGGDLIPLKMQNYKEEFQNAWICMSCFNVGCGRYSKEQHAIVHYKERDSHHIVFSPSQNLLWCYGCDQSIAELIQNLEGAEEGREAEEREKYQEIQTQIASKFHKVVQKAYPEEKEIEEQDEAEDEENLEIKLSAEELFSNGGKTASHQKETQASETKEEMKEKSNQNGGPTDRKEFDRLCAMRGLSNLGNTCFFNSCLQCLNASRPLVKRYLNYEKEFPEMKDIFERLRQKNLKKKEAEPKTKRNKAALKLIQSQYNPLNYTLGMTFQQYREGKVHFNKMSYRPSMLFQEIGKRCSRFQGYHQQDAHDLFLSLMDQLMSEEVRYRKVLERREKRQRLQSQSEVKEQNEEKLEEQKNQAEMINVPSQDKEEGEVQTNQDEADESNNEPKEQGKEEETKEKPTKNTNISEVLSSKKTVVEQIFGGFLFSSVRCLVCNNISITFDPYLDLSLEMPKDPLKNSYLTRSMKRQMAKAQKKKNKNKNKKNKNKNYRSYGYQVSDLDDDEDEPKNTSPDPIPPIIQQYVFTKEEEDQRTLESGDTLINISGKLLISLDEADTPQEFKGKHFYIYPENQIKTQYAAAGSSLEDCLKHFCSTEYMQDAANLYFCEKCSAEAKKNDHPYQGSPALRRMMLYKPNDTLVINLKRFTQATWSIHKNSDKVPFPAILDLAPYVLHETKSAEQCEQFELVPQEIKVGDIDRWKYELYGVVTHSGSIHGGHYVSSVLHQDAATGKKHWFYASDSAVRVAQLSSVLNSEAYMLFYRKIQ